MPASISAHMLCFFSATVDILFRLLSKTNFSTVPACLLQGMGQAILPPFLMHPQFLILYHDISISVFFFFFSFLKRQNLNLFSLQLLPHFSASLYTAKDLKRVFNPVSDSALPIPSCICSSQAALPLQGNVPMTSHVATFNNQLLILILTNQQLLALQAHPLCWWTFSLAFTYLVFLLNHWLVFWLSIVGSFSSHQPMKVTVFQGTVLGHLLFLPLSWWSHSVPLC